MSIRHSLLSLSVVLVFAGCAQEQPAITRVQPNYFDKSFFVGQDYQNPSDDPEFYSLATLVDVGYGAAQDGLFTSTYAQPLTRVKWTVQEDLLVARLAYERITNSDGKGLGKATNDGIVVAAYRIQSHFDIKRQYNPSTGEQLNVIEENTVDRPWYERQYLRVDWSQNLSTDNYEFDTLSMLGVYGGIVYEPLAYYVNDPMNPDAPHYDAANGYLDITNKAFAKPQLVDLSFWGYGAFPACWFDADIVGGTGPSTQCSPVELTIRQSFRKVEKDDYEPADWDGYRFQAFGAFTSERNGYARNYGMTDTQWHRFINRYDLWERSHAYADPATMTGPTACFTPETTPTGADPHRDLDGDGTEDECASVGGGSRCDAFKQRCTLPYRDRTAKTIAWYYAQGSNPEFFEPTRDATHEWDVALRSAVMTARYVECTKTAGADCDTRYPVLSGQQDDNEDAIAVAREVDDCRAGIAHAGTDCFAVADQAAAARGASAAVVALAKMPEAVVLCHSPVELNDPSACGDQRLQEGLTQALCQRALADNNRELMAECDRALTVRRGDLRYHQVNVLEGPQTPSPWGIMVDSNDPLTGKVVAASINVWSHVTDLWSQGLVDQARYIKGELVTSDITEGTYVREWAAAAEAASHQGALPKFTRESRSKMLADLLGTDVASQAERGRRFRGANVMKDARALAKQLEQVRADALAPSSTRAVTEARRKRALGTRTEAELTTKMMQSYAGTSDRLSSEIVAALASPLRGANPSVRRQIENQKQLALADRGACVMNEAPVPTALGDLSGILEAKFGNFDPNSPRAEQLARAERMRRYLARRAHYAVIVHEMGHSVGLRHNFVSSSDAFNYRPQYWQLRTDDGTNTTLCANLDPTGACVGPRYLDPVNETESKNLIGMFMASSVMDYAGEATQDTIGLGAYDFAAARMFYGESAAVFADPAYGSTSPRGQLALDKLDNFGGILGYRYSINKQVGPTVEPVDIHYSALQNEMQLIKDCKAVDPANFKPASWNEAVNGAWNPVFDGLIVSGANGPTRCRQQPLDYVSWSTLRSATAAEGGADRTNRAIDQQNRVRFPYGFATDRWADLGNVAVYRHDNGADAYELFDFLIAQEEINHIFDNYRRNRQTFTVRGAANRSLGRYNEKLRDAAKGVGLIANIYRDFAVAEGYDYNGLWPYIAESSFGDNLLAAGLGFDLFARQLERPEAGPHYLETVNGKSVLRSNTDSSGNGGGTVMNLPNGATAYAGNVSFGGHPLENALSSNNGEYDSEFTINAGSYYDKAWTAMLMTESVDNFISDSRRDFVDARYRAVSIADVFPDGYRRWLGNNLTGDDALKGPRLAASGTGRPLVDTERYPLGPLAYTSWWKPSPEPCFPNDETLTCGAPPANMVSVDPQVGWEQQKFLIAWTLLYLPENQQQTWLDMMNVWELGADTDPGFPNRIELHLPDGRTYVAKTYGTETIYGKTVQKGISARMLEWANGLLAAAYETTPGPDLDGDTQPDWVVPTLTNGQPRIKYDPNIQWVTPTGALQSGRPGCNATDNSTCTCESNKACIELTRYKETPFFMRQAMRDYGLADPTMKGLYGP